MLRSRFAQRGTLALIVVCSSGSLGVLPPLFAQSDAKLAARTESDPGVLRFDRGEPEPKAPAAEEDPSAAQIADLRSLAERLRNGAPKKNANKPEALEKGTSSDKVRKIATSSLPLDKLDAKSRQRVDEVLREVGFFRRMPTISFAADPNIYRFFLTHPDVAVSIWRAMQISELKMWQTGPNEFEGDAGDGTTGTVDVLFRTPEQILVLSEGEYKNPLLKKPIKAKSLVLLQTAFTRTEDGTAMVTHRADLFVSFPSQTVETAAKILSPLTGPLVDRTFNEMSMFLRMMTIAMTKRPGWVEQIATKMDGVHEMRKTQLLQLTAQVYATERKRLDEDSGRRGVTQGPVEIPILQPIGSATDISPETGAGSVHISSPLESPTSAGSSGPAAARVVSRDAATSGSR